MKTVSLVLTALLASTSLNVLAESQAERLNEQADRQIVSGQFSGDYKLQKGERIYLGDEVEVENVYSTADAKNSANAEYRLIRGQRVYDTLGHIGS